MREDSGVLTPEAFERFCAGRARRALVLAERYLESRQVLTFYGAVASFQGAAGAFEDLRTLSVEQGPAVLARAARELDEKACKEAMGAYLSGADRVSPRAFFARVLLQRDQTCMQDPHLAQLGVIVPQGDGTALELQCALCFEVWRHEKGRCHACDGAELGHYTAPELAHLEVQACESCGIYLNLVHQEKDPEAVPDVDEIAALPLDVWAREKGFRKPIPNLIGM